jgi:phage virion morphogenesis protein
VHLPPGSRFSSPHTHQSLADDYEPMSSVSVNLDSEAAMRALAGLEGAITDRSLMVELSAYLVKSTIDRFPRQTAPDGTPWLPLQQQTLARKRSTAILREQPLLSTTIREAYGDDYAGVAAGGPGVSYAAIHQFGGTPAMPAGPRDIPARPYIGVSAEDATELAGIVVAYLNEIAAGA